MCLLATVKAAFVSNANIRHVCWRMSVRSVFFRYQLPAVFETRTSFLVYLTAGDTLCEPLRTEDEHTCNRKNVTAKSSLSNKWFLCRHQLSMERTPENSLLLVTTTTSLKGTETTTSSTHRAETIESMVVTETTFCTSMKASDPTTFLKNCQMARFASKVLA